MSGFESRQIISLEIKISGHLVGFFYIVRMEIFSIYFWIDNRIEIYILIWYRRVIFFVGVSGVHLTFLIASI